MNVKSVVAVCKEVCDCDELDYCVGSPDCECQVAGVIFKVRRQNESRMMRHQCWGWGHGS